MEKKYISENRYKKVARSDRRKRTIARNKKSKSIKKVPVANNRMPENTKKVVTKKVVKKRKNKKLRRIILYIFLLLVIAIVSRLIFKEDNEPFIPEIFEEKIVNNQEITVGVVEEDISGKYINNVVIQELDRYVYPTLIDITDNYDIQYNLLDSVEKISNTEYILHINESYGINAANVKTELEKYMNNKENMYYSNVQNIQKVEKINAKALRVILKSEDIYFVYSLSFPIYTAVNGDYTLKATKEKRIYTRKEEANSELINKVTVITVNSLDDAVEKYKSGKIDMFFSNSDRAIDLLGKYEYNISSYRDGNSVFLLGNNESELIKRQEVRNAICYGIDRDGILKEVFKHNAELIDLPYIYDEVKYKYDYIAAENALLSNEYIKINKSYTKKEDGKRITLSLNLLVNKEDEIKIKIAKRIKSDLEKIGITINIHKLSNKDLINAIKEKDYDLVLADVTLNINPSIIFLNNHLVIGEKLSNIMSKMQNGVDKDILGEYNQILSEEFQFVGIEADNIYVIYNKEIENISNIKYMNIFNNLMLKQEVEDK